MAITLLTNVTAAPFVEVFVDDLIPEAASITVYRLAAGREFQMRGAVRAPTAGAFTRIDFEIPFNIPVTYRAELFDASGMSLGFTDSATTTLLCADTWMHNPLNPAGGVKVQLLSTAVKRLSRPSPSEVSYPMGRRVGVMLSEPRRGLAGAVFDVLTTTNGDADMVQDLIGSGARSLVPVICIRVGSDNPMRVQMPLFLGVGDIPEEDVSVRYGGQSTAQRIEGDEVDPPIPGLFIPLLTRADLNAFFSTRAAMNAGGLQRLDLNRKYDVAGTAG
jgi:hypothetical protein